MGSRLDFVRDWEEQAKRAQFKVEKLAAQCGVTERQLRRYFQGKFGHSPHRWMATRRAAWAKELLAQGLTVKEVAASAGFSRQENFSRHFKRHSNVTPTESRRL